MAGFAGYSTLSDSPAQHPQGVIFTGADHLPNAKAADWVTYADFVVAVTATSEQAQPIDKTSAARGEGIVARTVTLVVDDVLWAREADSAKPTEISWSASGWAFADGDLNNRQEMIELGTSRVEVGHSYIIAIKWEEPMCTSGPDAEGPRWAGLGDGAVLPFDAAVIGNGEYEGEVRTADEAVQSAALGDEHHDVNGVATEMLGKPADALVTALRDADPRDAEPFKSPTPNCEAG